MCSPPGDPGASRWRDRPAHGRQDDAGEGQDAADGEDGVEHPSEDVAVRRAAREDVPEDAAQARTAPGPRLVEGDRGDGPAKDSTPRTLMCGRHWQERVSGSQPGGMIARTSGVAAKASPSELSMSSPRRHIVTYSPLGITAANSSLGRLRRKTCIEVPRDRSIASAPRKYSRMSVLVTVGRR